MFSTGPVMMASSSASGPVFSFWRLWIGTVLLGALASGAYRRSPTGFPSKTGLRWTVLAGLAFGVHQVLFMTALRTTTVVDVTLMNTLAPLVVAVLAVPMFNERPGPAFRAWSVLAILGAITVAIAGSAGPQGQPVGVALSAGNVVFYSFFFVCSKRARDHITTMSFLAVSTLVAAVAVSVYVIGGNAIFGAGNDIAGISSHDLLLSLAVAALPGLIGHFSMTWSLKWVPANVPPVIMLSIPFLSGALAWLILGQTVAPVKILGGLITLVGVGGAIRASAGARGVVLEALDFAEE